MAPNDDEEFKCSFKCCELKTTNYCQCVNCSEIFYLSCAKVKNLEFVSEKFPVCCGNVNFVQVDQLQQKGNLKTVDDSGAENDQHETEISLLRKMISEMES